ncbi:CPP1-like family protein [Synechococcus sp. CS-197]|uniref:CPP1-like family protein n=1 Tax=Synechococcus sp. CS-197 TaxID=2847985 RepID=UPI0001525CB7|nr:CPP1-like family protein [Synechococcus sp. CS-197]MCT0250643.1 CPP1-like family protein [Synechococcus sp. CS-197]CAK23917.1 Cyanobacteria-specific chaperone containing DnaJ domain fused to a membrane domain [Synechococcus sp. WH 7803]
MAAGLNPGDDTDGQDPYQQLQIRSDASFDEVQRARDRVLKTCGEDAVARAKVEAAYDAVLMDRLRDRQSGRLSAEAATASRMEREQGEGAASQTSNGPAALLTRFRNFSLPAPSLKGSAVVPDLTLVQGQGLVVRLSLGALALLLLLFAPQTIELLLALGTIGLFMSQIRRGRRPLGSLGWSVLLLILGLVVGALLSVAVAGSGLPFTVEQWQSLPALLLLLAGTLLLA